MIYIVKQKKKKKSATCFYKNTFLSITWRSDSSKHPGSKPTIQSLLTQPLLHQSFLPNTVPMGTRLQETRGSYVRPKSLQILISTDGQLGVLNNTFKLKLSIFISNITVLKEKRRLFWSLKRQMGKYNAGLIQSIVTLISVKILVQLWKHQKIFGTKFNSTKVMVCLSLLSNVHCRMHPRCQSFLLKHSRTKEIFRDNFPHLLRERYFKQFSCLNLEEQTSVVV